VAAGIDPQLIADLYGKSGRSPQLEPPDRLRPGLCLDGTSTFVSVTQQFNTTTSMGRLTLNILLSFAQFEREVIGERIRDKFAASRKKGMWMGGWPPLGYEVENRRLVVVAR
jgi:Resolvase, N terminal domain